MMERLGLSLCVVALVAVLSVCGISSAGTSTSTDGMDDISSIASSYTEEEALAGVKEDSVGDLNFETDRIKIYCDTDGFTVPVEITDVSVIDEIVGAIDASKWDSVGLENEIAATPAYYIDFCNGTVLSMLSDTGYGSVGTDFFTEFDEDGNMVSFGLENEDGPYLYHDGLYNAIKEIMTEC